MSREEFSAYATPRYNEFTPSEREEMLDEWMAELEELGVDAGDDSQEDQDTRNQRSGRELELVKAQLKNMVSHVIRYVL